MIDLLPGLVAMSLDLLKDPPVSTIFLMVLAFAVSALTTYISRRSMNVEEYRKSMEASSHAQKELMDAMKSGNQRRIQKAQQRQKDSQQAQMKNSNAQMKTSMYTMIPMLIMWQILGGFYGRSIGVAWMPFNPVLWSGTKLNYITWYIICSFTGLVIAVSGLHGSGRSTHAKRLAETFGLRYVSSGTIFRQMAEERGLSLEEMSKLTDEDPEFDKLIDERAKEEASKGGMVLDATLAGWMAEEADLKIYLMTPPEARVNRIAEREDMSLEDVERETQVRAESERLRFIEYYDIDITDLSIYDVILNTDLYEPDGTARILKSVVEEYCKGR